MCKLSFVLSLALGAATLAGCDQDGTPAPTPAPAPPANPPAQPQASGTGVTPTSEEMRRTAGTAADTAKAAADGAANTVTGAAKSAADAATGTADAAKANADNGAANAAAAAADSPAAKEGQTLIDQVNRYIKERKFEDAEAALKKLEAMKDQLPASLSAQLPTLRKSLDTAKTFIGTGTGTPAAPGGTELPKPPGLNK